MPESRSGVAHFDTGDRTAMRMLSDQNTIFATDWARQKATIAEGEAGIGTDRIATAFRGVYQSAETLKTAADEVPEICQTWANVGNISADEYVTRDGNGAGAMCGPI